MNPEAEKVIKEIIQIDETRRKDGSLIFHGSLLLKLFRKKGAFVINKNKNEQKRKE